MSLLLISFGVFLICIFVAIIANDCTSKRISEKYDYPPMYVCAGVGVDGWRLNEPYWIKFSPDGRFVKNPLYINKYGGLKEDYK